MWRRPVVHSPYPGDQSHSKRTRERSRYTLLLLLFGATEEEKKKKKKKKKNEQKQGGKKLIEFRRRRRARDRSLSVVCGKAHSSGF